MKRAIALSLVLASGCTSAFPLQDEQATPPDGIRRVQLANTTPQTDPLPLRVPIKGVMAGVIDFSAHGVFTTATSETPLTQDDWTAVRLASINLISSATLITTAGSGPNDAGWVADPEWRRWAEAFQAASIRSTIAIQEKDRDKFLRAANALADACQSCHERFRIIDRRSPTEYAVQMAARNLDNYVRAWPAPGAAGE